MDCSTQDFAWPSLYPGVCSDLCPLRWCHPTISSSVAPFFSCPQSYPASESFPMIWLLASGDQSIGDSDLTSSNEYSGLTFFRIYWFDLFDVQGTLNSLLQHHSSKTSILRCSSFFIVRLSHPDTTLEELLLWLYGPLLAKWCLWLLIWCVGLSQLFFHNNLSRDY